MKIAISTLLLSVFLAGCASTDDESVLDRLEFEEGQEGCIRANGQIQTGNNPFINSSLNVNLIKTQGEDAPEC